MQLLIILFMTASLAWLLVWGMVKVIFIPSKTRSILGITWQAPIHVLVKKINLTQLVQGNADPLEQLMPLIDTRLDDFFRNKLSEKLPMISMFIGDKTIQQLKEVFMAELTLLFPELIQEMSSQIQTDLMLRLQTNWIKQIELELLLTTAPLRKLAVLIGIFWGLLLHIILTLF